MKTKQLTKYAVLFLHSRGWTYVNIHDTAGRAQTYIRDHRTSYEDPFQYKIVPCKVVMNLPDKVAENFQ